MTNQDQATGAAGIKVLCSNSTHAVMEELVPAFEHASGHRVSISYDSAITTLNRIKSGETADVIILNAPAIDEVAKQGRIAAGSRGLVEVEVRLHDGRSERTRVERAPGSPARELSWNDLHAKFMDCAHQSQRVSENAANEAFDAIRKLEHIEDVTRLTDLLR